MYTVQYVYVCFGCFLIMASGAKGSGFEKDKASLAMEFFICFLIVPPHKEVFVCFWLTLTKEILCQVENRRSAAFTGGKGVGKSLSSCDGILNVPPPVMAASQCFFLTCFLMLPPHLQSLVIICLSSHFLRGKNQFLLSGRNFIRNSFLASLLLQPAMPPDRYPSNPFLKLLLSPPTPGIMHHLF